MARSSPVVFFKQSLKSDSFYADEIINVYLLRPIAACLVWLLYPTRVTPNQVTVGAVVVGLCAACFYALGSSMAIMIAGLLVTVKDILDDADGQLARAKEMYSRQGRFVDSIGDFIVDIGLFSAITYVVYQSYPGAETIAYGLCSFVGITLRVSYHVYYQVSFFHLEDRYKLNRITEEITDADRTGDQIALRLQQVFLLIYGWQDKLIYRLDRWCMRGGLGGNEIKQWYTDRTGLRLSGLLGFGTEFAVLTICSLLNQIHLYLLLNLFLMNGIWLLSIIYRRFILARSY